MRTAAIGQIHSVRDRKTVLFGNSLEGFGKVICLAVGESEYVVLPDTCGAGDNSADTALSECGGEVLSLLLVSLGNLVKRALGVDSRKGVLTRVVT